MNKPRTKPNTTSLELEEQPMSDAMKVQITKIKISKDKTTGRKLASIELTRQIEDTDEYEGEVAKAINQITDNDGIETVSLSTVETPRSLSFSSVDGRGSDFVPACALEKFKIRRECAKPVDIFYLSFEFTIPLKDAKRWLIPSIGDLVGVLIENSTLPLPFSGGDQPVDRVN